MQRKNILFLCVVFLATFPISLVMGLFTTPVLGLPIAFVLHSLGVYWVTVAEVAFVWSAILTSLFFTYIAWLIKPIKNGRNLAPIVVFFVALPVMFIMTIFNPLSRPVADSLRTIISADLVTFVLILSFIVLPSLFLAFFARVLVKSKKEFKIAK